MIKVTLFKGLRFTTPVKVTSLEDVLNDIKSTKWKTQVEKCHVDLKNKDWLPCFTPTGVFSHRSIGGLEEYNGVICLDLDHVEFPETLKTCAKNIPWVHAAFITPSGKGLKVIVLTNATINTYKEMEEEIAEMFRRETNFSRDNRCKDISRIQFISHDPNLYYNPNSQKLILL